MVALDIKEKPGVDFATLSTKYGVKVEYLQADVTSEDSLKNSFDKAVELLGTIDGAVTCAGLALEEAFEETSWKAARRIHDVNVCVLNP